jgi:Zn finger protein HypA/HybF involved in hydrogenase expression
MDGIDLRKYEENEEIHDAFSKLVSGKPGYKTIIEKRKDVQKCKKCSKTLSGEEKFCPECGAKIK